MAHEPRSHTPATSDTSAGSVRIEGSVVVIRVPLSDAHALRVALAPCPCKGPKSHSTEGIRERLARALGRIPSAPREQGVPR